MSATTETRLFTAEEFLALYEEESAELIRGEVVHMIPPGVGHSRTRTWVLGLLCAWCEQTELGEVIDGTGIILTRSPDTVRAPDVVFYVAGRAPHPDEQGYLETIPDLVAEVASRGDAQADVLGKAGMWLDHGVREVWVVWPWTQSVTVLRGPGEQEVLHLGDVLSSPDILPGFELPLERLFG